MGISGLVVADVKPLMNDRDAAACARLNQEYEHAINYEVGGYKVADVTYYQTKGRYLVTFTNKQPPEEAGFISTGLQEVAVLNLEFEELGALGF